MFGQFVQKLQSFSPLTSPQTSPLSSPKFKRKFGIRSPSRGRRKSNQLARDYREVQSEPELDDDGDGKYGKVMKFKGDSDLDGFPWTPEYVTKTVGRIIGKREVQRLARYDRYFQQMMKEAGSQHPDYENINHLRTKTKELDREKAGQETDLDRIQDVFPSDQLYLYEKDAMSTKMKGLLRKRSTTANKLQRAFSAKSPRSPTHDKLEGRDSDPLCQWHTPPPPRNFIMDSSVKFTTGVQNHDRHLFLFTDLLLVAKSRSGGNYKLKEKVRVSELWLASCIEDVAEINKSAETSFVMGWPTTNTVVCFTAAATKDLWLTKLTELMTAERGKEPAATTIQVVYYDTSSNIEYLKTLSVSPFTTAKECIHLILGHLEMKDIDAAQFQLWVRTFEDDSLYPLIGHEYPFAIKMNAVREYLLSDDGAYDLADHFSQFHSSDPATKCQFVLRNFRNMSFESIDSSSKKIKKQKRSPIKIQNVFRRTASKGDITDGSSNLSINTGGLLFGQPLVRLCENEQVPKAVMEMMQQLFQKGPYTHGIFRKSANARQVRELREKLDNELEVDLEAANIFTVAALIKDFLRSLPTCLLGGDLYEQWMEVGELTNKQEKILRIQRLFSKLPRCHVTLLQHFLCVLYSISRRSSENMMTVSNLAVCVGPSLIRMAEPIVYLSPDNSKTIPSLVAFVIEHCAEIFGQETLKLFGEAAARDPRLDSGAEESDSLHSCLSHDVLRRDDSSIDSLEREYLGEHESLPQKDKMSLINLSRDSGLTMSDSQLYTPDEEENSSTSSSNSNHSSSGHGSEKHYHSTIPHYSAPNNPNAIYSSVCKPRGGYPGNVDHYSNGQQDEVDGPTYCEYSPDHANKGNFQRQDWFRRRSNARKPLRKALGSEDVPCSLRRSASEESLLNYSVISAKRPALHRKGRAPPPPPVSSTPSVSPNKPLENGSAPHDLEPVRILPSHRIIIENNIVRSQSVNQLGEGTDQGYTNPSLLHPKYRPSQDAERSSDWQRSQSTSRIDEVLDRSYDSSTLSDEDSTPHVSRSNSRGKDCHGNSFQQYSSIGVPSPRPPLTTPMVVGTNSVNSVNINRTGSQSTVKSTDSSSTLTNSSVASGGHPPSYEETMNRRHQLTGVLADNVPDCLATEQTVMSAKAKQLYEESLRIYQEQTGSRDPAEFVYACPARIQDDDDYHGSPRAASGQSDGDDEDESDSSHDYHSIMSPPPLPPKADPPPLPPKQRLSASKSSNYDGTNILLMVPMRIEVESSDHQAANPHLALKRVTHYNPGIRTAKNRPVSLHADMSNYICAQRDTQYYSHSWNDTQPPVLPPKERFANDAEPLYSQLPRNPRKKCVTRTGGFIKNAETQTDSFEDKKVSREWSNSYVTSVEIKTPVPSEARIVKTDLNESGGHAKSKTSAIGPAERKSRGKKKDQASGGGSQRSRSLPSHEPDQGECHVTWSTPGDGTPESDRKKEISWSVSQLRSLFSEKNANGVMFESYESVVVNSKGSNNPPPYRHPPSAHSRKSQRQSSGQSDPQMHKNQRRPSFSSPASSPVVTNSVSPPKKNDGNYGEESYV